MGVYLNVLGGLQRSDLSGKISIPFTLCNSVGMILAATYFGFSGFLVAIPVAQIFQFIGFVALVHHAIPTINLWPRFERQWVGKLFRFSTLTLVGKISWVVFTRFDLFIISQSLSLASVGYIVWP